MNNTRLSRPQLSLLRAFAAAHAKNLSRYFWDDRRGFHRTARSLARLGLLCEVLQPYGCSNYYITPLGRDHLSETTPTPPAPPAA